MKVKIIDENHIMIMASEQEVEEYSNCVAVCIDSKRTFVCCSEPSSLSYKIMRDDYPELFNTELDISYSPFTTNEFLVLFLEMDDYSYPVVLPCYNSEALMDFVANKSGIFMSGMECKCGYDINGVYPILLYYGFKLSLSVFDIKNAIKYWDRLFGQTNKIPNCGCHG